MSLHMSAVCIRGSHISRMSDLLSRLDYRIVGSPLVCTTAAAAATTLAEPTRHRDVVRKAAYESDGWTWLLDPELVVMTSDDALSDFAREHATDILAWLCEGASGSYGFRLFSPELRRDVLAVDGAAECDTGDRLAEEHDIDWSYASEDEILELARRLGAPYDYLSTDRNYFVYALDESGAFPVDTHSADPRESPSHATTADREHSRTAAKPWWKFW